jgi:hypothetical protein
VSEPQWCQPADRPERRWIIRFDEVDCSDRVFTDESAARHEYALLAPGWNVTLLATAEWCQPPKLGGRDE